MCVCVFFFFFFAQKMGFKKAIDTVDDAQQYYQGLLATGEHTQQLANDMYCPLGFTADIIMFTSNQHPFELSCL
jgi:hypothetical protein